LLESVARKREDEKALGLEGAGKNQQKKKGGHKKAKKKDSRVSAKKVKRTEQHSDSGGKGKEKKIRISGGGTRVMIIETKQQIREKMKKNLPKFQNRRTEKSSPFFHHEEAKAQKKNRKGMGG